MLRLTALVVLLSVLILIPARAQEVRRDSLNGWGITLRSFDRAAEQAGRTDWPSSREGRPGTCVQITFDPQNADVTLVTPLGYGSDRLLEHARRLAADLQLSQADFITVETRRTAIADIELNDYLQRRRLARRFDLDLSALAAALARSGLPQPVVIGVKKDEAITLTTGGASRSLKDGGWFAALGEVPSGSRLTYEMSVSWRVIPGLLLFGIAPLAAAILILRSARRRATPAAPVPPPSPEEVQRRYDRQAPVWTFRLGLTFVPVVLLLFADLRRLLAEMELLIPGGFIGLAVGPVMVAMLATVVTTVRQRREREGQAEPLANGAAAPWEAEDRPPTWARVGPLGVLALGMLAGPFFILIPVYDPAAQLWLRNGVFLWIGLTLIGAAVMGWLGHRASRIELKSGPWFDLVTELAASAKVRVHHVVLIRSPFVNASASLWGTVGLTTRLVRQLDAEEVRAVVAHELGHLKLKHPHRTLVISLVTVGILSAGWWGIRSLLLPLATDELRALLNGPFFFIFLMPIIQMLLMGKGLRAREEQADRLAVQWTGDPELVIRVIERLHHLNQSPGRLKPSDEALSTHPSLVHRLAAIREQGKAA